MHDKAFSTASHYMLHCAASPTNHELHCMIPNTMFSVVLRHLIAGKSDALNVGQTQGQRRTKTSSKYSVVCVNQTSWHLHVMLLAEEEEEDELGEPLILRIDQDDQGSVGSEDTSRFDSDDDLPLPEIGQQLFGTCQFLPFFSKKPNKTGAGASH